MRVGFAGTPEFARLALQAILEAGFTVPVVFTQPDRPAGRGLKLAPSAVKVGSLSAGLAVAQPRSLRLDGKYPDDAMAARQCLQDAKLDVLIVAAYGLILPQWVLDLPKYGCLNIHASLLPRWRGAAPIQRAIEAGDAETGVTIMQMDAGLDTGDILLVEKTLISSDTTGTSLHDALAEIGARLIVTAIKALEGKGLSRSPQASEGITYAAKLDKAEAALDLQKSAVVLARRINAFNPVPGATIKLPGIPEPSKVWRAQALSETTALEPGAVVRADAQGIDIACGEGVLRLLELQRPGGKRQVAASFIQHLRIQG
jgi:methionyl-tRNA formyltransferase